MFYPRNHVARFARWLLGGRALRVAGAATAWLEFTIAPLALMAPTQLTRRCCIAAAVSLHIGIAMTMRNTVALDGAGMGRHFAQLRPAWEFQRNIYHPLTPLGSFASHPRSCAGSRGPVTEHEDV